MVLAALESGISLKREGKGEFEFEIVECGMKRGEVPVRRSRLVEAKKKLKNRATNLSTRSTVTQKKKFF